MKNKALKEYVKKNLCPNFCAYYKPLKKEDLACLGLLIIERLMEKGKNISFDRVSSPLRTATGEKLIRDMCTKCPFYADDCDFVQQSEGVSPCGGFLLLGHLLERHIISIDDIQNII
jgi:hypothetical protein